ncbi:MAG: tyrosine-type recombinase/integrase [Nitrospira sp.]|nr:tyrosine-type recombinase/integrase [Nitrospira sp.]
MPTRQENNNLSAALDGVSWIMEMFPYGTGLRLRECLRLRVHDIDVTRSEVLIREGQGDKDRVTMLPASVVPRLNAHLGRVRTLHADDFETGFRRAAIPDALARKDQQARREWGIEGIIPASTISIDHRTGASDAVITCTNRCRSVP